ncbi:MAG: hypothetical protein EPO68_11675 [Planctomycetota bacterium]|nr:MAG: hypothetical protein EPO68_11675 [Planctomycetota bacterium]
MKYALGIVCLSALSLVLLSGSAAPSLQAPKPASGTQTALDALTERVTTLEKQLVTANAQCTVLSKDLDDTRALLDKTLAYLGQQALAARDMSAALDTAEQQGFAVGENHPSRKTLLEGWRKQIAAAQADLPQAPKPVAPTARATPQPRKPVAPPQK